MIICAALKIAIDPPLNQIIICGLRHPDCFETFRLLNKPFLEEAILNTKITQGFINHKNEFKTREEAYQEALACGQISAQARHDKKLKNEFELFSEDLY